MKSDHDYLRRADLAIWMTNGIIAFAVAGFVLLGRFDLEWHSFLIPVSATALLALGGWFYRSFRNDARLDAILTNTAQLVAFAAVAAPLSYVAATAGYPLQDATLDAWDRHLGMDWTQLMIFVALRPRLQFVLLLAYSSFALQSLTPVLALGIAGRIARLKIFIGAFIATTLVTIAISTFLPAAGPWLFLDLPPAGANGFLPVSSTSWPVFLGLRDGTLHSLYGLRSEGIITFPSLHAALGVLFAAALWPVKRLRWIALILNGLLLIATPTYGSHYFIDVIAGIAIAAACWIAIARFVDDRDAQRDHFTLIQDPPSIVPETAPAPMAPAELRKFESV
jgi:hypothetical protein